jgi:hypothetical protein
MSSGSSFFSAPNDEIAASTIVRSINEVDPDFLFANGVDPFEALPRLEELLTGRSCDAIRREFSSQPPVALAEGGEGFIAAMSEPLAAALASADREQLTDVAVPLSQIEEFEGRAQPDHIAAFLYELADLVHRAHQQGRRVYGPELPKLRPGAK